MYVNVTDPKGFQYTSGEVKPAVHRLLFEGGQVYGVDNLSSHFRDSKGHFNVNEWTMFLQLVSTLPSGTYVDLTWERE